MDNGKRSRGSISKPDAVLDLAIKSTDKQDEGLLFEAWTERIPPRGTEVLMELVR